jgi:heme/copper-type cytochrome/quinol oxidase subunit 2
MCNLGLAICFLVLVVLLVVVLFVVFVSRYTAAGQLDDDAMAARRAASG